MQKMELVVSELSQRLSWTLLVLLAVLQLQLVARLFGPNKYREEWKMESLTCLNTLAWVWYVIHCVQYEQWKAQQNMYIEPSREGLLNWMYLFSCKKKRVHVFNLSNFILRDNKCTEIYGGGAGAETYWQNNHKVLLIHTVEDCTIEHIKYLTTMCIKGKIPTFISLSSHWSVTFSVFQEFICHFFNSQMHHL